MSRLVGQHHTPPVYVGQWYLRCGSTCTMPGGASLVPPPARLADSAKFLKACRSAPLGVCARCGARSAWQHLRKIKGLLDLKNSSLDRLLWAFFLTAWQGNLPPAFSCGLILNRSRCVHQGFAVVAI
jgi:hypothetical protein